MAAVIIAALLEISCQQSGTSHVEHSIKWQLLLKGHVGTSPFNLYEDENREFGPKQRRRVQSYATGLKAAMYS